MNSFERFLDSTFELVDVLKSSEQSFVALVYDKHAQRLCTLKRRSLHSLEIYRTLKNLAEPHVPEIYRLFERDGQLVVVEEHIDGQLVVVEEHIDGQTLDEILTYRTLAIDENLAAEILKQLCACLAVIHGTDIVHRDIKPSNIMLANGNAVKLIDFGIARKFKPESRADTELLGTRGYASPEQFGLFDFGQTDARSDIYSLGVTLKQLLGEDYRGRLLKILNRCTALEPSQRYQSAAELLNAVNRGRRLQVVKKIFAVGAIFVSVIAVPAATTDIRPTAHDHTAPAAPAEKFPHVAQRVADKTAPASLNQDMLNQLIDFANTPHDPIESPPAVASEPLPEPARAEDKKNTVKTRESFDGVNLYFYLNGTLTGTDSHLVNISDWQNWTRHDNGVFFPADWTARLHVENHGDEDLIDPIITVVINQNEYPIRKPTVSVGQSLDVDIPLANKFAAPLNGVGIVKIVLQARGRNPIYLNRTFKLVR